MLGLILEPAEAEVGGCAYLTETFAVMDAGIV